MAKRRSSYKKRGRDGAEMSEPMCYVAKAQCGHYYYAAVDYPDMRKDLAKEIAEIISRGDIVERQTCDWMRKH